MKQNFLALWKHKLNHACKESVWGDCYCVIIYNTPSIIVCVTHSQVQNSERLRVGECGSKLHKPASLWCVWCENIRLLFPVSQDFTAACENWGCTNWGCKTQPSFLPWSKEQRYREGTTREALSMGVRPLLGMGMRPLLFYVYWLQQLTPNDETFLFWCIFSTLTVS